VRATRLSSPLYSATSAIRCLIGHGWLTKHYFTGKVIKTAAGDLVVTEDQATDIEFYLIQNGYVDKKRNITDKYHDAKKEGTLGALPDELKQYSDQVLTLIDSVFSDVQLPLPENGRGAKPNLLNENFNKKEFKELWSRINRKAAYGVQFDSAELIDKCVKALEHRAARNALAVHHTYW